MLDLMKERGKTPEQYPDLMLFEVMDKSGDTKIMWDRNNQDEVKIAKQAFEELTKTKKFVAFYVTDKDGTKGEQMREFDPRAERVIFVPPMAGG